MSLIELLELKSKLLDKKRAKGEKIAASEALVQKAAHTI